MWAAWTLTTAACSVYDTVEQRNDGAGSGGAKSDGAGGAAGSGGSDAGGTAGSSGASSSSDGSTNDLVSIDADAMLAERVDTTPILPDAPAEAGRDEGGSDPRETGPPDIAVDDVVTADGDASETSDVSSDSGNDVFDSAMPPSDARDTGTADTSDADSGRADVFDSGPTGPQILPRHGSPLENPDAGAPFDSRCASDEVVTGLVGRAGAQTDAVASTCSKLIGGVLSSPRNLPLNGNLSGGSPVSVQCPASHAAVGIVGRYGHSTMWNEDITTMIGVVCKNLSSTATQIVTITGQAPLDAGYTSFREDCTNGRFLTDISGRTDANSLGYCVQQVGGECDFR